MSLLLLGAGPGVMVATPPEVFAGPWPQNDAMLGWEGSSSHAGTVGRADPRADVDLLITGGTGSTVNQAVGGTDGAACAARFAAKSAPDKARNWTVILGTNETSAHQDWADMSTYQSAILSAAGHGRFAWVENHYFDSNGGSEIGGGEYHNKRQWGRSVEAAGGLLFSWSRALLNWQWLHDNWATPFVPDSADAASIALKTVPVTASMDGSHLLRVHSQQLLTPAFYAPWAEALNGGRIFIAPFQQKFSAEPTRFTAGGFVCSLTYRGALLEDGVTPATSPLVGASVELATADADFAVGIVGQDIRVSRVTAGQIADGRRRLFVRVTNAAGNRVYPVDIHLRGQVGGPALLKEVSCDVADAVISRIDPAIGPWLQRNRAKGAPAPAGKKLALVMQIQMAGAAASAGTIQRLIGFGVAASTNNQQVLTVQKAVDGKLLVNVRNAANTTIGAVTTTGNVNDMAVHWLFAWGDLATGVWQCALDTDASAAATTATNDDIDYARDASWLTLLGGNFRQVDNAANIPFKGRVGSVWVSLTDTIDFSVAGNRDLFRNAGTKAPVLASESGVVAGITPHIWMPPWLTAGDVLDGKVLGSLAGQFVAVDKGRCVQVAA